jgi:peptidoglycan/LPS O-acetylase OafA/YrhL
LVIPPSAGEFGPQVEKSRYRPDIDGLRAIAVLVVVGYHAFPGRISGGFVGVDIFFVISGYLITDIIFRQMIEHRFTVLDFYKRRILRIFPALLLVTLATFAFGWFVLPPLEFQSLGINIGGAAVFIQNILLIGQIGYFEVAAGKRPLLHLWSLGIEEQYYIAWPVILLMTRKWRLNAISVTGLLILLSFWLGIATLRNSANLAFYLPFTRAWELLIGSVLAISLWYSKDVTVAQWVTANWQKVLLAVEKGLQKLVWASDDPPRGNLSRDFVAFGAIAAIFYAVFRYSADTPYPGYYALVPSLAAAVLIATPNSSINRIFLSSRPMISLGLISYPLYLWHYPLMAYARILAVEAIPRWVMFAIIPASATLAWLTYKLIERPFRFGAGARTTKTVVLLVGMAMVGMLGLVVDYTNGLPSRIPKVIRGFMLTGDETSIFWRRGSCLLLPDQGASSFTDDCRGDGQRPLILVWGDSYAAALYPGLNYFSAIRGYGVAEYTSSACPPLINFVHPERRFCKTINDDVLNKVASLKPEIVMLHSTWSYSETDLEKGLAETISRLKNMNIKRIVILGPVSTWKGGGLSANVLDYYYGEGGHSLIPERTTFRSNDEWTQALEFWLEKRAQRYDIEYVSARRIMCNAAGCLARLGKELTAFDNGHLTVPGSKFVVEAILDQLKFP